MPSGKIHIMVSRHSAFYSPLIATVAAGFLGQEGLEATYEVLPAGVRSHALLREGRVDVMQSAVGSNWGPMERGETDLPVHFAQINRLDGFFLAGRKPDADFHWKKLEGARVLADHGKQPLLMLQYAAHLQKADWGRIEVIDAGTPAEMEQTFRDGEGDYVHLQGPAPQQLERDGAGAVVASVGEAMPPVAFSSLMATREFLSSETARVFTAVYHRAREWARTAPPEEVAAREASFFPDASQQALAAAISRYQKMGCWEGGIEIPRNLYRQALEVFLHGGAITRRHAYEDVVAPPPA